MLKEEAKDKLIVALDLKKDDAIKLGQQLIGHVGWVKVGMTLYFQAGPSIVKEFSNMGFKVFLDLKLFDIPHQVKGAAAAAASSGANLLSIHALGGADMIRAAKEGVESVGRPCDLLGITVLTSMNDACVHSIGIEATPLDEVCKLGLLAFNSGTAGIVCSPNEAKIMRNLLGEEALIVCPGIRPLGASALDQSRIATPASAIEAGATHLVVGRPITEAPNPCSACDNILAEITGV